MIHLTDNFDEINMQFRGITWTDVIISDNDKSTPYRYVKLGFSDDKETAFFKIVARNNGKRPSVILRCKNYRHVDMGKVFNDLWRKQMFDTPYGETYPWMLWDCIIELKRFGGVWKNKEDNEEVKNTNELA